ncbi:MAG: hypothetical protein R3Y24_07060 [Eubacteriales bacterium]
MISPRKDQEPSNSFICVIDNLYRISVYIKIDSKQLEEVIVSFHENNIPGMAKSNIYDIELPKYVPVFADSVNAKIENENKYVVKIFVQRGLKVLPIEMPTIKCQDTFIVKSAAINVMFLAYCNDYIKDLFSSNLSLDFDKIEVFSMLQQISFTAYGKDTFSSISLLIDNLNVQSDYNSKKDGVIYDGKFWLIKYPKNIMGLERTGEASYSISPLSEYLGSHIFDILGYDVHETMLATREGKIVVACKDFAIEDDLIEIRTIKNHANGELAQLLEEDFSSTGSDHVVVLKELLLHLNNNTILKNVVPIIKNNMDRIHSFIMAIPEKYEFNDGRSAIVCSEQRKKVLLLQLQARLNNLLLPYYEEVLEKA